MSTLQKRRKRWRRIGARDNMRPTTSICPWCKQSDRRPKVFKNGSHEARRALKAGLAHMTRYRRGWPGNVTVDRTVCAHICHSA